MANEQKIKFRDVSVWKDLLPKIFPVSCNNHANLWKDIENGETQVIQIHRGDCEWYMAFSVRGSLLQISHLEGKGFGFCGLYRSIIDLCKHSSITTIVAYVINSRLQAILIKLAWKEVFNSPFGLRMMKVVG